MEEQGIRNILKHIVTDEKLDEEQREQAAREIRVINEEAKEYGFNEAEAVRAISALVLSARQRTCNCPSCRSRRSVAAWVDRC